MTKLLTTNAPLIEELQREAETTRRVLARIPEDKLGWAPHGKSMTLGRLAMHIATIPGGLAEILSELERELPDYTPPAPVRVADLLVALDRSIEAATAKLAGWTDSDMAAEWRLVRQGRTLLARPRGEVVRTIMLNHWYHHRGQLTVYLRLLDVPLPPVYGPTADEQMFS